MRTPTKVWIVTACYTWIVFSTTILIMWPIIHYVLGPIVLLVSTNFTVTQIYQNISFHQMLREAFVMPFFVSTPVAAIHATYMLFLEYWDSSADFRRKAIRNLTFPLGMLWGAAMAYALHWYELLAWKSSWLWLVIVGQIIWLPIWYLLTCKGRGIS